MYGWVSAGAKTKCESAAQGTAVVGIGLAKLNGQTRRLKANRRRHTCAHLWPHEHLSLCTCGQVGHAQVEHTHCYPTQAPKHAICDGSLCCRRVGGSSKMCGWHKNRFAKGGGFANLWWTAGPQYTTLTGVICANPSDHCLMA